MIYNIPIQNLKCGGCEAKITNSISSIEGVSKVTVDNDTDTVQFEAENEEIVSKVEATLSKLGYPKVDDPNNIIQKAKSYVSCMIGRVENLVENK